MVHFGNQLKFHQVPEWAGNYLDYDGLKNIIKEIINYRIATDQKAPLKKEQKEREFNKRHSRRVHGTVVLKEKLLDNINQETIVKTKNHIDIIKEVLVSDTNKDSLIETENNNTNKNQKQVDNTVSQSEESDGYSEINRKRIEHLNKEAEIRNSRSQTKTQISPTKKVMQSNEINMSLEKSGNRLIEELNDESSIADVEEQLIRVHLDEELKTISTFTKELINNINKIDNFYSIISEEISTKLASLNKNYHYMNEKNNKNKGKNAFDVHNDEEKEVEQFEPIKKQKYGADDKDIFNQKEKYDEFGFSTSWKRAYGELYNKASWLHGFCAINKIALSKIIKKFEKVFIKKLIINEGEQAKLHIEHVSKIHEEIKTIEEKCRFSVEIEEIASSRVDIIQSYADFFCNGNSEVSKTTLEERLKGGLPKEMKLISFYIGVFITMVIFGLILFVIPCKYSINLFIINLATKREGDSKTNLSLWVYFPPFNFILNVILLFFGLAFNLHVFNTFRVNYIYIFEIDPAFRLTPLQLIKVRLLFLIQFKLSL